MLISSNLPVPTCKKSIVIKLLSNVLHFKSKTKRNTDNFQLVFYRKQDYVT